MDNEANQYGKAQAYARYLLKLRPRSNAELRDKLRQKAYSDPVINKIVADLEVAGELDDVAFTKAWIQGRMKNYGFRRLALELSDKGIPKDIIHSTWDSLKDEVDEESIVRAIAYKRGRVYHGLLPWKQKRLVMDYLVRRGFNPEVIGKVIREL